MFSAGATVRRATSGPGSPSRLLEAIWEIHRAMDRRRSYRSHGIDSSGYSSGDDVWNFAAIAGRMDRKNRQSLRSYGIAFFDIRSSGNALGHCHSL